MFANLIGAYYQENYGELNTEISMWNISIDTVTAQDFTYPVLFRERVSNVSVNNVTQNGQNGVCVMAHDEDEIEIKNCGSVSGIVRDSVKNWKRPY